MVITFYEYILYMYHLCDSQLEIGFGNVWKQFSCHNWKWKCHWQVVDRGQGCCQTSYNEHNSTPTAKDHLAPNVNSAVVEQT